MVRKFLRTLYISIVLVANLNPALINASEEYPGSMDIEKGTAQYKLWPRSAIKYSETRFTRTKALIEPKEDLVAALSEASLVPVKWWGIKDETLPLPGQFYRLYGDKKDLIETRKIKTGEDAKTSYDRTLLAMTDLVALELLQYYSAGLLEQTLGALRALTLASEEDLKKYHSSTISCPGHDAAINAGHITTILNKEHVSIAYEIITFKRSTPCLKGEPRIPPNIAIIHGVGMHTDSATTKKKKNNKYTMTTCTRSKIDIELN